MSGLVTTTCPAVRMADRIGAGVSPSYVAAATWQRARLREPGELRDLVLAERLRREQEQRARRRVLGERLQDRQRVAQRLARRGRRHDDDVLAGVDRLDRLRLVAVQRGDPAVLEARGRSARSSHGGNGAVIASRAGRRAWCVTAARERRLLEQPVEDGLGGGRGVGAHGAASDRTDVRLPGVYAQRRAAACHLGCHSPNGGRPHRTAPDRTATGLTRRESA